MSAKFDRAQGFKFYYGNAAQELNEYLPRSEAVGSLDNVQVHVAQHAPSVDPVDVATLNLLVDNLDAKLQKIEASQQHLSFLIADLKRIIA